MTQHQHLHHHDGGQAADHEAALAELLDLDAKVLGTYLAGVTEWVGQQAPATVRTAVDLGAGTGTGSLALAQRFPAAEVVAIDRSALLLERLQAAAREQGLADRVRIVQADLDVDWPAVGDVELVWAASSLHEITDPDRVLHEVYAALNPGGLLAVVEMDAPPRFLPDDIGLGRPGLEARCHEAAARENWNSHPNWRPHLTRAGFQIAAQRRFAIDASPGQPSVGRYAHAYLRRIRSSLAGQLAADDLDTLDQLLSGEEDSPEALLSRRDLTVRGHRTAWAARRR